MAKAAAVMFAVTLKSGRAMICASANRPHSNASPAGGLMSLTLAGSRRWVDGAWVGLAGAGIALIAPWGGGGIDGLGMVFSLAAGGFWAVYIVLGQRTAAVLPGPRAVAVGMLFAVLPVVPFGVASGSLRHLTPHLLLLGAGLAVFSSVLPFTLEMRALRTMPTRTFSILMSLEPVAAALSGWLLLGERLTAGQWLAVGLIVTASAGATLTSQRTEAVGPDPGTGTDPDPDLG